MTEVGLVWAQSTSGVIGRGGGIPWTVPEDLARFKEVTIGHIRFSITPTTTLS